MEAPDKIWINTDTLNGYYMSNHPLCGEEYIRKDALLEWAKEGVEHYKKLMEDFKDDHVFAASFGAYNAFVEKLNKI